MDETNVAEPQQLPLSEQDPNPQVVAEPEPEAPELAAIRTQLVESQRRESEANSQRDAANARFDQYLARTPGQSAEPAAPRVDPMAAPDPAVDPEGFQRHGAALRAQDQRDIDRRLRESQEHSEKQHQETLSRLQADQIAQQKWIEFQAAYPEHAHQQKIATLAFNEVYPTGMPVDSGGVLPAVKAKMDEMIGTPTPAPNRTGGVGGGSAPPRAPAPPKDQEKPMSMVDMISQQQLDDGLI